MRAPEFWDRKTDGFMPSLLRPLGCAVSAMAALRQKNARPYKASVPIICVGNLVAGGAGKTPVAIDLVERLTKQGVKAHVLLRGYGGTERGPTQVDLAIHNARRVGDEALLLAKVAPTWVSEDRKEGVLAAIKAGAQVLVLDDGFQNPSVHKDLSLLVVDGEYGFGNGRVMPAGPLRESVIAGLKRADSIVLLGSDAADIWGKVQRAGHKNMPILRARIEATPEAAYLKDQDVYAFAGIGRPQKFFDTLTTLGAKLVGCKTFDDHHPYTDIEIETIIKGAGDALIVTTTKDLVRISKKHQGNMRALNIAVAWKHSGDIDAALKKVMTDE
ncbi:MAG: tetraacyldisaccharide 4'-kinase [Rhodospirillaceae bacterium]|nr:MAG: tetraacyldisaccharide 4'-kinase [Rhodospirillaceae bacterium]